MIRCVSENPIEFCPDNSSSYALFGFKSSIKKLHIF
ncbi:unnamed protein product [Schistosoma mattheei]|uniref:Uncharacterized protein n=3 Tax=Schistosoma TaxID=6181 RepID=A0A183KL14_9TREM|nr:unnamed protein product [Schistosoma margrebowiei]VDP38175.1 unnamed protein product [Schistosoma mattheei]VDP59948.1 unnamed protein product [Schistosoma curassoni]